MAVGGTADAGSSSRGGSAGSSSKSEKSDKAEGYSKADRQAKTNGKGSEKKSEQRTADARNGREATVEEQGQKARDFDHVQGRPALGERRQEQSGAKSLDVTGLGFAATSTAAGAGLLEAGTTAVLGGSGTAATVTLSSIGAVGAVLTVPINSNLDENVPIPGHEHYRIAGKETEVSREVQVANADGSWTTLGTVSARGGFGGSTTFDMSELNDILKDRGYEPVTLPSTSLPGTPIGDGPKGPSIVFTPDHGPWGLDTVSTPIPEEQGPQILEARNTKADGRLKELGLPTEGEVTFDPPKNQRASDIRKQSDGGYQDTYGNSWKWSEAKQEWDVTLTSKGKNKFGHLTKGREHLNVAPDGKRTH